MALDADIWLKKWLIIKHRGFDYPCRQAHSKKTCAFNQTFTLLNYWVENSQKSRTFDDTFVTFLLLLEIKDTIGFLMESNPRFKSMKKKAFFV